MELAADGDSPVCGKAPSGETGPTGAAGGAPSVGELPVGASRGRDVPRAAPCGRPPPVAQLLTSPVPISSTATARATPGRPRPGPTHLPAATSATGATAEPTGVVKLVEVLPAVPAFPLAHRTSSTIRSGYAAGARCPGRPASTRARRDEEVQEGQASTWTRLGVPLRPPPGRPGRSLPGRRARAHRAAHPHPGIWQPHCRITRATVVPRQQGPVPPLVQHGLNVSVGYRPAED